MNPTLAVLGIVTVALALPPDGQSRRTVHLEGGDCSQTNMMFGDFEVARAEQRASVPLGAGVLDVQPEANGGVRIERGTGRDYSITAWIGAGAATLAEAQSAADAGRLVGGGRPGRGADSVRAKDLGRQVS